MEAAGPTENLKASAWEGLVWGVGFTIVRDVLQFATMIVLVRLLTPEMYGQMAVVQSIIALLSMISFRAFGRFALQSRDPSRFEWSNHFSIGIAASFFVYCISLILVAIGLNWGGQNFERLAFILCVASLVFLLEPLGLGYTLFLQANHRWKQYRLLMLISALFSSGLGITLALYGFGVIALAAMIPATQVPFLVAYFLYRHPLRLRIPRLRDYKEGRKFAGLSAANGIFGTGSALIEKSLFSTLFGFASLGIYTRGLGLVQLTSAKVGPVVVNTLYPVLTRAEASSAKFRKFAGILISGCIIVSLPMSVVFAVKSEPIVLLFYGENWIDVARLLPPIVFIAFFGQLIVVFNEVLIANLRQAIALNLAVFAGLTRLAVVVIALPFGVDLFLYTLLAQAIAVFLAYLIIGVRVSAWEAWPIVRLIAMTGIASAVCGLILYALPTQYGTWLDLTMGLIWQGFIYGVSVIVCVRLTMAMTLSEIIDYLPANAGMMARRALRL